MRNVEISHLSSDNKIFIYGCTEGESSGQFTRLKIVLLFKMVYIYVMIIKVHQTLDLYLKFFRKYSSLQLMTI